MAKKSIKTLTTDIEELILNGKEELDQNNLEDFLSVVREEIERFLSPYEGERKRLRLSAIGRTDRKLWYEINDPVPRKESPALRMRFFYGHLLEALLLYLVTESGHKVEDQQKEVELEGVKGHIDAVIDGALVDVKSASDYGFKKFKQNTLEDNDPFGYISQISAYMEALDLDEGGFLAINKNNGEICMMQVDELMLINASNRVKHLKKMVKNKNIPERCFTPIPDGNSGNMILVKDCVFCDYKNKCWQDTNDGEGLRVFKYANGYRYFTKVVKEPNVEEVL